MTDTILARLESRAAISDLIHRYALNIRNGYPAECAGLFTDDAVFEVRQGDLVDRAVSNVTSRSVGRKEIIESVSRSTAQARVCPLIQNLLIDVRGRTATSNCMMVARVLDKGFALLGEYRDSFRQEDVWRFSERIYTIFGRLGSDTV